MQAQTVELRSVSSTVSVFFYLGLFCFACLFGFRLHSVAHVKRRMSCGDNARSRTYTYRLNAHASGIESAAEWKRKWSMGYR